MNRYIVMGIIAAVLFYAGHVGAKDVNLSTGETFHQGELTVTCGQATTDTPLALKDCQYWDTFNQKCLFEKTTYSYKNLECVENCQYWDKFNGVCHYQTKCTFYPSHMAFVQTTCEKFDDFNDTCLKTSEMKIGRSTGVVPR